MNSTYVISPVGVIRKKEDMAFIEIEEGFEDALLGLDQFSHINVLTWFHKSDNSEKRSTLQVHPRHDRKNPLTGVFATRSPARPNLIALFRCGLVSIKGRIVELDHIDAYDGSPVIDIKPYIPSIDALPEAKVAWWAERESHST
ncbi:MAG: tRNA (N6-threonylcarbamoyladenosine(37)-N6)-methyltransferase TrmO [Deltaproteobacteria bacterium]|nr:tRNA (N6-threonylcarbamoyladenosine(37)-N6)-methyltransferase TrmO [Deltaproteobacteria bacterium]